MRVTVHETVAAFDAAAGPLYDADPARHTLAHTALVRLRDRPDLAGLLLTVAHRGETAGALLQEAGRPATVSALPPVLAAAAADRAGSALPAVHGPVPEAEAFAAAYTDRTGQRAEVAMRMRLFRLVTLTPPRGVEGVARVAGEADLEVLVSFMTAFTAEAVQALDPPEDPRPWLLEALAQGAGYLLWEVGGVPVAVAGARRPIGPMSRVGPVYTPPEERGHGYGTAVTAAATAWARAAGAREVVLLTDLANPVSNEIYPRIGYRPVLDAVELRFTARA